MRSTLISVSCLSLAVTVGMLGPIMFPLALDVSLQECVALGFDPLPAQYKMACLIAAIVVGPLSALCLILLEGSDDSKRLEQDE